MTLLSKSFRLSTQAGRRLKASPNPPFSLVSSTSNAMEVLALATPTSTPARSFSNSNTNNNSSITTTISSTFISLYDRYSVKSQQQRALRASHLFEAIRHQAHDPKWYISNYRKSKDNNSDGVMKLKPEFRQIHAMLSLHIWFIHRRLYAENQLLASASSESNTTITTTNTNNPQYNANLLLQEELFDIFWTDTMSRIRAQGVNELTVNKHLKDAQRATFVHCTQLDHAFAEYPDDMEKRFEVVCDAVWRHILGGGEGDEDIEKNENVNFNRNNNNQAEDELIRRIGAYIEYQLENIVFRLPDDYFEEGRIGWGNIPDLDDEDCNSEIKDHDDDLTPLRGMNFLDNNWVQVLNIAGTPYYWNMTTHETRWDRP
eukprot:CAMPEP_0203664004 /NCGR_PEP_ID=MMETSP0090-20130426/1502_1 /ASSEMBLY_ACC=CAM_ASM_001088 /TAXON_ID=426623 /ORGANISM="Chaetoceros affinis, Strain CCMP159" /LENGTH=372 /DNA_ID=CAMNT_0050527089 /DNA_START=49 /DNA_END=1167 /DNA_ORIENTATION=-